jgi:integrase
MEMKDFMPRQTLKQRADGRYICRCDGRYFLGKTQKEALAARDAYKLEKAQGLKSEARGVTLNAYAAKWLPIAKANVSKNTYNEYARMLNVFISHFDSVQLQSICSTDVAADFSHLQNKSKSYIHKYTQLVTALFRSAREDGLLVRSPVTKSVAVPEGSKGTHRALEEWERALIVASIGKHDFSAAAMLMLYAGLRRGEMLAFNIDRDVDFKRGTLQIREAIVFENNRPVLTDPKTEAGVRTIPLFAPLRAALEGKHGLVLPTQDGSYMSKTGFRRKWNSYLLFLEEMQNSGRNRRWYGQTSKDQATIAAGGQLQPWKEVHIQTHDFRHTFATMLWEASVDLKTAMKWMGHADQTMILKVYAHLTDRKEEEAALKMAKQMKVGI